MIICSCINILSLINIISPINFFYFFSRCKIPNLYLIFRTITTNDYSSSLIINRITRNMWTIKMSNAFSLSYIPNMHDTIPSTRYKHIFVNEFHTKYTIIMAEFVPASFLKCMCNCFCFYIFNK
jgi:hypothetical protein